MRKFIRLSVCLLLAAVLFVAPASVLAQGAQSSVVRIESLQYENNACLSGCTLLEKCGLEIVEQANARIEQIIRESCRMAEQADCKAEVDCIIFSMLLRTETVSKTAQLAAAVCGVKTVCEYVPVEIGGRVVYVDPLRVILV